VLGPLLGGDLGAGHDGLGPDSLGPVPPGEAVVDVDARIEPDGTLVLAVTDHGRWRPADPDRPGRGLGLTFVEQLADDLDVERSDDGTRVTVRVALRRPAGLLDTPGPTGAVLASPAADAPYGATYAAGPPAHLAVHGAVDAATAADLHDELARRAMTGTTLVVDLGGVTLLASAGVHALARALDEARARHATLRLVAPSGTPAHHVLTLAHLPLAPADQPGP
jgi:anti-anti-sigma factor